jgi:hypothetical protein
MLVETKIEIDDYECIITQTHENGNNGVLLPRDTAIEIAMDIMNAYKERIIEKLVNQTKNK